MRRDPYQLELRKAFIMVNKFQILSLDGGGIKGIFSAAVLAHLEDDLQIRICGQYLIGRIEPIELCMRG